MARDRSHVLRIAWHEAARPAVAGHGRVTRAVLLIGALAATLLLSGLAGGRGRAGALSLRGAGSSTAATDQSRTVEKGFGLIKIAVVGSSHAQHAGLALANLLPASRYELRPFVTDAATAWKNVSWCGGIHFPIWKFLPSVDAYNPHIVILCTENPPLSYNRRNRHYHMGDPS
ncbi:hypothetical protein T492DRAFT_841376 [Pavlovales sp. CCMP2436]|nr:hypothetical protein T492DRAFT_841376 [Pavlovales sp. CCMP2436]